MSEFITLTCPSCSGKLEITEDIDRFACMHCGTEQIVKRSGGIVALKPVLESVSKGVDSTASELALVRLDKEIAEVGKNIIEVQNQLLNLDKNDIKVALMIIGVLLAVSGVLFWGSALPFLYGLGLIVLGIIVIILAYKLKFENPEKEKAENLLFQLQTKLEELKTSRQNHYDRVNK